MHRSILDGLARRGRFAGACLGRCASACSDPVLKDVENGNENHGYPYELSLTINKDVDILFVVDNSGSMAEEQLALATGFDALVEVLERPGAAVDYRIGITTTDDGNPWCGDTTPEEGALQLTSCRSRPEDFEPLDGEVDPVTHPCLEACPEEWTDIEILPTAIQGSDELRPRDWIESSEGLTNLPEGLSVTQAFQCFAPQGITGCGFESPLESMWKTVVRSQTEDDPAYGFIRPNAVLSIVHVTDEMDCSYDSDWESIFLPDGNRVFWSDPEAASPTSAVCWNAGVACEGTSPYEDCRAVDLDVDGNEVEAADADDLAVLRPVSRYVDILQDSENSKQIVAPDQEVLVSVIGGVGADGVARFQDAIDPSIQQAFGIGPGCEGEGGPAVPPVRLQELAEAFQVGDDRNMFSICRDDYSPALAAIAEGIIEQLPPPCMPACVADTDPSTDEVDPSCRFAQQTPRSDGGFEELEVLPCEPGDALPDGHDVCFVTLVGDERSDFCTEVGFNLELRFVRREGAPAPDGTAISGICNLSDDKRSDCPDLP
jgi:hypothetical protein